MWHNAALHATKTVKDVTTMDVNVAAIARAKTCPREMHCPIPPCQAAHSLYSLQGGCTSALGLPLPTAKETTIWLLSHCRYSVEVDDIAQQAFVYAIPAQQRMPLPGATTCGISVHADLKVSPKLILHNGSVSG